jgi:hypothetical protein
MYIIYMYIWGAISSKSKIFCEHESNQRLFKKHPRLLVSTAHWVLGWPSWWPTPGCSGRIPLRFGFFWGTMVRMWWELPIILSEWDVFFRDSNCVDWFCEVYHWFYYMSPKFSATPCTLRLQNGMKTSVEDPSHLGLARKSRSMVSLSQELSYPHYLSWWFAIFRPIFWDCYSDPEKNGPYTDLTW